MGPGKGSPLIRFGVFEVDLREAELRKRGIKINLQEQPFRILTLLLESPGKVVSRETLRQALWPANTFVDFEHSLNAAVAKLRQALGDSAENPRFIETLARRGYRFLAPIERSPAEEREQPLPEPPAPTRGVPWRTMLVLLCLGVLPGIWWIARRVQPAPELRIQQLTFDTGSTAFPTLSRDGKLLAYSSNRSGDGRQDIWVQQIGGSGPIQVTRNPAADISPDFSPDGTRIVFRSHRDGGGVYIVSVFGTGERKLADRGWRPRFSPDGKLVVYSGVSRRPSGDLYVISADGGQPWLVSIGTEVALSAAAAARWTPDGKQIVFAGAKNGESDWWVVSAKGGVPVRTGLRDALSAQGVSWSVGIEPCDWKENRHIFAVPREKTSNLWEAPFAADRWTVVGPLRRITFGSAWERNPRVSDAGQIVFTSESFPTHLWSLPLSAAGQKSEGVPTQLTFDVSLPPGDFLNIPRFSANSKTLVYTSERFGNRDVWLRDMENGVDAAVTANLRPEDQPLLSRDGRKVAYQSQEGTQKPLYVADVFSRVAKEVCPDCAAPEDWSADDRGIYFLSEQRQAVYLLDLVTLSRSEVLRLPGLRIRHVTISPNGRWLAVTPERHRSFLVRLEKGRAAKPTGRRPLADDLSIESVHWSQDGERLYFFSHKDDFRCLMMQRINTATGEPRGEPYFVHHFHDNRRQPWSSWLSVAGNRVIVRITEPLSNIFLAN